MTPTNNDDTNQSGGVMSATEQDLTRWYPWYAPHQRWLAREGGGVHADLHGADLSGATLRGATLNEVDLSGADLSGADLSGADLSGADLREATLRRADLSRATLHEADLRGADLSGATLRGATLSEADLRGAALDPVPVVPDLDQTILDALEAGGTLDMSSWHTCRTAHCRAGWAVRVAGVAGQELETRLGANAAGALIYAASRPDRPVPDFYDTDEAALADIRACAQ